MQQQEKPEDNKEDVMLHLQQQLSAFEAEEVSAEEDGQGINTRTS